MLTRSVLLHSSPSLRGQGHVVSHCISHHSQKRSQTSLQVINQQLYGVLCQQHQSSASVFSISVQHLCSASALPVISSSFVWLKINVSPLARALTSSLAGTHTNMHAHNTYTYTHTATWCSRAVYLFKREFRGLWRGEYLFNRWGCHLCLRLHALTSSLSLCPGKHPWQAQRNSSTAAAVSQLRLNKLWHIWLYWKRVQLWVCAPTVTHLIKLIQFP